MKMFRVNKIYDRNMEIVPGSTTTFWVAFKPTSLTMTGLWKFALYDVPVSLDAAGRPTRTTRFETRIAVKEVEETFRRESLTATPQLLERRETTATGETKVTRPAEQATPTARPAAAPAPVAAPVAARAPQPLPVPVPVAVRSAPAATSAPPSVAVMTQAQARLNALGFNTGKPDGIAGARTRQAIEQFQKSKGLETNGQLDRPTMSALGL